MSSETLTILVLVPTAAVVIAVFMVLWNERTSLQQSWVAGVSGAVLTAWALTATILAYREFFRQPETQSFPPIGIYLAVVLVGLLAALTSSSSLRRLLTNQKHLTWLHVWRLEGIVFLILMWKRQMPALWALPAGIGDIMVGASAPWVARGLETARGRTRAIVFNLFGLTDLVVAVALGVTTNPGPAQVFHTTPTSELVTHFPLVLVPAFLVPLAFTLHLVSLAQLLWGTWALRMKGSTASPA